MRVLTILSGILMLATGAFCFINPGQTFLVVAFIVGIVMVINGIIHTLAYLIGRGLNNKYDNNGWILVDALITLLLGVLVLCNQLVVDMAIPMVFGMWVLTSGVLRVEAATHINRERKMSNFRSTLATGILTTIVGLFGFINPLVSFLTTIILLGMFLCVQGVNIIELGVNMPHERKEDNIRKYRRKVRPQKITEEDETQEAVQKRLEEKARKEAQAQEQAEIMETIGVVVDEPKV